MRALARVALDRAAVTHKYANVQRGLSVSTVSRALQQPETVRSASRGGRSALAITLATLACLYAGGAYGSLKDDRLHDFFIERIPWGLESVALLEHWLEAQPVPAVSGSNTQRTSAETPRQTVRFAAPNDGPTSKLVGERIGQQRTADASLSSSQEKALASVDRASGLDDVPPAPRKGLQSAVDLTRNIEEALGLQGNESRLVDGLRPADAHPSTRHGPPMDHVTPSVYEGPPLPLGFSPPPDQFVPHESDPMSISRDVFQIPPLPRLNPAIASLDASEPILGQLADSIDRLAAFLQGAAQLSVREDARDPKEILQHAQVDLKRLSQRLDELKKDASEVLNSKMEAKTAEYQRRLEAQYTELMDQIEAHDDGWRQAFDAERNRLFEEYKEKLNTELTTQQAIINERLREEVIAQGVDMQRQWLQEVRSQVEKERAGRLGKLEALHSELRDLGDVALGNSTALDTSLAAHRFWTAARRVSTAIALGSTALGEAVHRLRGVVGDDAGAEAIITESASVLTAEKDESAFTMASTLAASFNTKVAFRARRTSLIPDNAGCLAYFASVFLSLLLASRDGASVQGSDVASVLARAQYRLDRQDVDGAVRECNQLRGWTKILLHDWLKSARQYLELRQAAKIAILEANVQGLKAC